MEYVLQFTHPMASIVKIFNTHFMEFCEDISKVFPDNKDIQKVKFGIEVLQKTKPKIMIEYWKLFSTRYTEEIERGDLDFFVDHDYRHEMNDVQADDSMASYIDKFRGPIRDMGEENKEKSVTYIQNLTKMSKMYSSN